MRISLTSIAVLGILLAFGGGATSADPIEHRQFNAEYEFGPGLGLLTVSGEPGTVYVASDWLGVPMSIGVLVEPTLSVLCPNTLGGPTGLVLSVAAMGSPEPPIEFYTDDYDWFWQ